MQGNILKRSIIFYYIEQISLFQSWQEEEFCGHFFAKVAFIFLED